MMCCFAILDATLSSDSAEAYYHYCCGFTVRAFFGMTEITKGPPTSLVLETSEQRVFTVRKISG